MSFEYLPIRAARQQAGLEPLPDFIRDHGNPLPGDASHEFIDTRYFSPEAQRYMTMASEYQSQGGRLNQDDLECMRRIWQAVGVAGRRPTSAQIENFNLRQELKAFERMMSMALEDDFRRRGYYYGPDDELPDGVVARSEREAAYDYIARKEGRSRGAVKAWHQRTLRKFGTR